MEFLFSLLKHAFPNVALAVAIICFALQEHLSQTDWWPKLPWGTIAMVAFAFWLGYAYSELANPHSGVRHAMHEWSAAFKIKAANTTHVDIGPGKKERIEIWCLIQFERDLTNPLLVVRVTSPFGSPRAVTKVVMQERLGDVARHTEKRIVLGQLAVPYPGWKPHPSYWGTDPNQSIIPHSQNIVEISAGGTSKRIYVRFWDQRRGDVRRVFVATEEDAPFAHGM